ncbi:uncharacterized protein EV422DRAFT_525943 [Fimicolochytrium jonesii]|uniref:uncharacterized protein n=1 Tax=Fimicolochytrium jonesii TaxID=1396493 RepID=UPI0022FECB19|nr:uncharacterized protein EV422DRAFT_525943 [Fimicolochytrium jonesii]KAI8822172.1 hypothetical protein EV422DRAFT_525943 [Fimicolochytrium jonesii]
MHNSTMPAARPSSIKTGKETRWAEKRTPTTLSNCALPPDLLNLYASMSTKPSKKTTRTPSGPSVEKEQLLHDLQTSRRKVNELSDERKTLKTKVRALEEELGRMDARYEEMLSINVITRTGMSVGAAASPTTPEIVYPEDRTIRNLRTALRNLEKRNKETEKELNELKQSLRYNQLFRKEQECVTLFQESLRLRRALAEAAETAAQSLKPEPPSPESIDESLRKELTDLRMERDDLRQTTKKTRHEVVELQRQLAELKSRPLSGNETARFRGGHAKDSSTELREQIKKLTDQRNLVQQDLNQNLAERTAEKQSALDESSELKRQLLTVQRELKAAKENLAHELAQKEQPIIELDRLRKELSDSQKALGQLEAQMKLRTDESEEIIKKLEEDMLSEVEVYRTRWEDQLKLNEQLQSRIDILENTKTSGEPPKLTSVSSQENLRCPMVFENSGEQRSQRPSTSVQKDSPQGEGNVMKGRRTHLGVSSTPGTRNGSARSSVKSRSVSPVVPSNKPNDVIDDEAPFTVHVSRPPSAKSLRSQSPADPTPTPATEDVKSARAATSIQAAWRHRRKRKAAENMQARRAQKEAEAAIAIQRIVRGRIARSEVKRRNEAQMRKEVEAAVKIQRLARGRIAKKLVEQERRRRESEGQDNSNRIEVRPLSEDLRHEKVPLSKEDAARRIQAATRTYFYRKRQLIAVIDVERPAGHAGMATPSALSLVTRGWYRSIHTNPIDIIGTSTSTPGVTRSPSLRSVAESIGESLGEVEGFQPDDNNDGEDGFF